jgi:dienelactone hydrolase
MKNLFAKIPLIIGILLISCSGSHSSKNKDIPELEKGKVIPSVTCIKNVSHTYALYLPSNYSAEKKYPLIICFDAHASGYKPVELFQQQAEKFGYIIAGSNVSKNGLPMQSTFEHYDILLDDLLSRLSVDRQRLYTCGFSGGSRVASSIAISKGGITGVIGCSAGFPQVKDGIPQKFDFFGYAGNDDMNYAEMVSLDRTLENSGFRHQLLVFNGTHDWPPKESIAECILWTELNAMKDIKKAIDKVFVKEQLAAFDKQLTDSQKSGNAYEEYLLTKKIINYFKGLADVKKYEDQLAAMEKDPEVQNGIMKVQTDGQKEQSLQQQYLEKLTTESLAWWKGEVKRLDNFIATTKDETEKHLLKRVLEYLSLALYSNSSSAYAQGSYADAEHFIELYALIDPDNPEPEFMWSQIFARKKDVEKSIEHLKKAAGLGFKEKVRIDNDSIFLKLNSDKRLPEIIDLITKNQNKP